MESVFTAHPDNVLALEPCGMLTRLLDMLPTVPLLIQQNILLLWKNVALKSDLVLYSEVCLLGNFLDKKPPVATVQVLLATLVEVSEADSRYKDAYRESGLFSVALVNLDELNRQLEEEVGPDRAEFCLPKQPSGKHPIELWFDFICKQLLGNRDNQVLFLDYAGLKYLHALSEIISTRKQALTLLEHLLLNSNDDRLSATYEMNEFIACMLSWFKFLSQNTNLQVFECIYYNVDILQILQRVLVVSPASRNAFLRQNGLERLVKLVEDSSTSASTTEPDETAASLMTQKNFETETAKREARIAQIVGHGRKREQVLLSRYYLAQETYSCVASALWDNPAARESWETLGGFNSLLYAFDKEWLLYRRDKYSDLSSLSESGSKISSTDIGRSMLATWLMMAGGFYGQPQAHANLITCTRSKGNLQFSSVEPCSISWDYLADVIHPSAIALAVQLLPACSKQFQEKALNHLLYLSMLSERNRSALVAVNTVSLVVDLYEQELTICAGTKTQEGIRSAVLSLVRILAPRSPNVSWRRILRLFKCKDLAAFLKNLVEVSTTCVDLSFVHFDGEPQTHCKDSEAGRLEIRQIFRWPPTNGYSIVAWINLSDSRFGSTEDSEEPCQLHVLNISSEDCKSTVQLYVEQNCLRFSTGKDTVAAFSDLNFRRDQWYHIGLVHSKSLLKSSIVSLYIDGVLQSTSKLQGISKSGATARVYGFVGSSSGSEVMDVHRV